MNVIPYKAEHLLALQLQAGQRGVAPFITPDYAKMLEGTWSFTAMVDGDPIAVCGITELWTNRAMVWSFLGQQAGPHFFALTKACKRVMDLSPYRRLEAEADCEFAPAHRWLRILGFEMEAPRMRAYRVDGGDSALYARMR
jgi:hypothetical protein